MLSTSGIGSMKMAWPDKDYPILNFELGLKTFVSDLVFKRELRKGMRK